MQVLGKFKKGELIRITEDDVLSTTEGSPVCIPSADAEYQLVALEEFASMMTTGTTPKPGIVPSRGFVCHVIHHEKLTVYKVEGGPGIVMNIAQTFAEVGMPGIVLQNGVMLWRNDNLTVIPGVRAFGLLPWPEVQFTPNSDEIAVRMAKIDPDATGKKLRELLKAYYKESEHGVGDAGERL